MPCFQPGFRQFDLPAVVDALAEHAVDIADAVAVGRQVQRGQAFHEARRQPAKAAIAERRVGFQFADDVEIDLQQFERLRNLVHDAEVRQRVAQQPADQEFQRQVIDTLGAGGMG
ncbi:MAG: hypothetical protein WDN06_09015 [Asticcacaulis sp.]